MENGSRTAQGIKGGEIARIVWNPKDTSGQLTQTGSGRRSGTRCAANGGLDRNHGLQRGRRAVSLSLLDEFQPKLRAIMSEILVPARNRRGQTRRPAKTVSGIASGLSAARQINLPTPIR